MALGFFSALRNASWRQQIFDWTPADYKTTDLFIGTLGPQICIVIRLSTGGIVGVEDTLPRAQARMHAQAMLDTMHDRVADLIQQHVKGEFILNRPPATPTTEKRYHGLRSEGHGVRVTVTTVATSNTVPLMPEPSQRVYNHSPTGFEWGYQGSGPSQLALAILLDHFDEANAAMQRTGHYVPEDQAPLALRYYQDFKQRVVAGFSGDEWLIDTEQIALEIAAIEEARQAQRAEVASQ